MGSSLSRLVGYACAAVGAAFFSTKAIFIKLAYQDQVDAALFLAYRMIFATPVFVAIGAWAYARRRADGEPPPDFASVAWAAFIGLIGYYVASAFDFAGLQYISAALERLVLFTYPLFVMFIGAALYGEAVTGFGIAAAAVTYIGLAIVFAADLPEGGRNTAIGTALVLGAAISFAWHQILAKRVIPRLGSMLFTSIALSTAGVACVLHQVIIGSGSFAASPRFLWLAFGCAIIATVLPTFLINAGLARVSSSAVSMISTVSPIVTIGLAITILGEPFTLADAVGAGLVLAGVGLFTWGDARARKSSPTQQKAEADPLPAPTSAP
ncbi:DMT family transporter [uncultured Hyphomicrobium sp.]|uniref:DMT family transporter n=1 Tax=uncultured Hyphomicrobium sp. TaxID=194373 RepID=UPI0025D98691|nr:DMT family transporter [uncultured Hyphomicrobium sp.]